MPQKRDILRPKSSKDFDLELEDEVNMGEIPGKYFVGTEPQKKIINGVKKTQSEQEREKARLLKAQKAYADQLRAAEKVRLQELNEQRKKTPEKQQVVEEVDESAETEKRVLPHS